MTQKSILITGASSGIGYDSVLRMRALGWRVFAAVRQESDRSRLAAAGKVVHRNDPCPCGSGLKYKQCHGKLS